jgi:drug/metabolite transporter (DMT)-like permease
MKFIDNKNATVFLFINAIMWGSSYVWSKMLLGYLPRFSILFICSLGGLISTVVLFYPSIRSIKMGAILSSASVSILSILSNTFFMFALQHTSSSNTAFIVQASVVITPLTMALIEKRVPKKKVITSAFIALAGIFLMTCSFGNFKLNVGDLFAVGNAVFFSLFLTTMKLNSKKVEPLHFTFVHHTTNTVGFLVLALLMERQIINFKGLKSPVFALLISASVFIAVVTVLIQSTAIKFARPEKATLIYTFEPVSALFFASALIGEKLEGAKSIIGSVFIIFSIFCSMWKPGILKLGLKQREANTYHSRKPIAESVEGNHMVP